MYNKILYVTRQRGAKCARNMCVELSGCDEMQSTQRVLYACDQIGTLL